MITAYNLLIVIVWLVICKSLQFDSLYLMYIYIDYKFFEQILLSHEALLNA